MELLHFILCEEMTQLQATSLLYSVLESQRPQEQESDFILPVFSLSSAPYPIHQ